MSKRIEILRVLNNILLYYVLTSVFLIGMKVPAGTALYVGNLLLALFVLVSELIQGFITNLILFLLGHILAIFAFGGLSFFFTPNMQIMLLIRVFVMIIITIIAIYSRIDGKGRFYPQVGEAFLFPATYLFCRLVIKIAWAVLCIIYYNARQTAGALVAFKKRDYVPYEAIQKTNGLMLRVSIAVSLAVMLIVSMFDYGEEVLGFIKRAVLAFLRWIFSFFKFEPEASYEVLEREPVSGSMSDLLPRDYQDDSIWHEIWQVLYWIVAVAVAVFIMFLFVKLMKNFYKLFNSSGKGIRERLSRDKVEFLNPFNEEKDSFTGGLNEDRLWLGKRLSKEGRIRAMFVKYVKSGRNYEEVKVTQTSSEMEKISRSPANTGILAGSGDLGDCSPTSAYKLYDKARYSSREITREDILEMKKIVSQ